MMKKTLINWLGLLGIVSLLSYTIAVIFSPLAYPGYDWRSQGVSDLSAMDAPSKMLWNQLSSLYGVCGMISIMMVCVSIKGKLNKQMRIRIYLFALMNWITNIGYTMFPISNTSHAGTFQDIMHIVVTIAVILLSVISLLIIIYGGFHNKRCSSLAIWAVMALSFMLLGAIGVNIVPPANFGIPERFSVFAATGFNAVLGFYLFHNSAFNN